MRFLQALILIVFLAAIAVFALQNNVVTTINYPGGSRSLPLPLLIVGVYLLGMVSGGAVVGFIRRSIRNVSEQPR